MILLKSSDSTYLSTSMVVTEREFETTNDKSTS